MLGIIGEEGEDVGSDDDDSEETTQENKDNDTTSEDHKILQMKNNLIKRYRKEAKPEQRERIFISPLARNMAKDKELDITRIKGTGGNDVLQN